MPQYKAKAKVSNGDEFEVRGTLRECASWADNIISIYGTCTIDIESVSEENCQS